MRTFFYPGGTSGHGVQMFGAPAAVPRLTLHFDLSLSAPYRNGGLAVLSASNDGDEIPPEKLEHLFDRFYRVDEVRNSEGHHCGLGLSIAKAVTEKHGGKISVSCKDGKIRFAASIPEKNR